MGSQDTSQEQLPRGRPAAEFGNILALHICKVPAAGERYSIWYQDCSSVAGWCLSAAQTGLSAARHLAEALTLSHRIQLFQCAVVYVVLWRDVGCIAETHCLRCICSTASNSDSHAKA